MYTILAVIQILVCVVLVAIVLMQSQQSMNLSGMFGGASQSALGSQPQSVLSKATTVLAIVFMVFSLVFSFIPRSEEGPLSTGNIPAGQPGASSPASSGSGQQSGSSGEVNPAQSGGQTSQGPQGATPAPNQSK